MQRIDLTDAPDQRVSAVLDGRRVTFRFRFNATDGRWFFDLALDDQPILYGRRIVAGRDLIPRDVLDGRLFAYVYGSDPKESLWFVPGDAADHFVTTEGLTGADLAPFGLYDGRPYHLSGGVQPGRTSFVDGTAALFFVAEDELQQALAA